MPLVLQLSSASALNISILSSDFYSLMFGIYLFRFKFHWLYVASYVAVITGFLVYFLEPTQPSRTAAQDNDFHETHVNSDYRRDMDIQPVMTITGDYMGDEDTTGAYNQYNSQYNMISVSDLQNTYMTAVNVHSRDEFNGKPID
ncbi:unnamed protein product [Oppiella nova]|uniref:Uncharacterized protein n=1 Tax=Oppiella nova TaxID=334625 RepID=A0A7R9LW20_9ACAR|nr:unnamed protein product [Oppiella nova]CAG2167464.1 unnamed protein product [Oppiella nova]